MLFSIVSWFKLLMRLIFLETGLINTLFLFFGGGGGGGGLGSI